MSGLLGQETMMPNVQSGPASAHSVRYLDVAPMISALRVQPSDFEYSRGWLNHVPSRHRFQFDRSGRVTIDALCGCAALSVRPEQADELHTIYKTWRHSYWVPLETEPGVRVALPRPQSLGQVVPRHPHGLAALPARGRASDHPRRSGVGDAGGVGELPSWSGPRRSSRRGHRGSAPAVFKQSPTRSPRPRGAPSPSLCDSSTPDRRRSDRSHRRGASAPRSGWATRPSQSRS